MRLGRFLQIAVVVSAALGHNTSKESLVEPKSDTVPMTLDHNRIVIDVDVTSSNGATQRVHAWVDNGNADLEMSRRLAALIGLTVTCDDKTCSAPPPAAITIGTMKIPLSGVQEVKIPLKQESGASVMAPGVNAEINIPSTVLRNYDVLISFPDHKFTIGQPGSLKFNGVKSKMVVNPSNGIIEIPSEIDNKKYNLGLDLGSSISFLSGDLFDKLSTAHSGWPHMIGAVGPANMWGAKVEAAWKLLRVERVQYGPLFLSRIPVVNLPQETMDFVEKRAGVSSVGTLGSEALLNYRVGLDYAHSTAYFDIGRTFNFPDFDVIGLILRPEDDGRFTIVGVADFDGKASVPEVQVGDHLVSVDGTPLQGSTMGQVWSMLGGAPAQERMLVVERSSKQFNVSAGVQHFLEETEDDSDSKKRSRKN
jgi:hypothetical protein